MPKREDERLLNLAGGHPAACTCQDCTDRFLKGKKIKPQRNRRSRGEKVAKHPTNCTCASCGLLRTMENLPLLDRGSVDRGSGDRRPGGFLKRLFRKR